MKRLKFKRVDFSNDDNKDFRFLVLVSLGIGASRVARNFGWSAQTGYYRLKKAKIKATDYRNGQGLIGRKVLKEARLVEFDDAKGIVRAYLDRKGLSESPYKNGKVRR
jgi:hypothetical protein